MGVTQILRDFSGWTSAHGIPHIGSATNLCLRIFWTLMFLGATGMFGYQMILLITKYLSYDVSVQTELKFEERYFPAVTICNLNPYKKSMLYLAPEIENLMANYTMAVSNMSTFVAMYPNDYWGFSQLKDEDNFEDAVEARAREHLILLSSDLGQNNPEILNLTSYAKEDFFLNCAYNTRQCDMTIDIQKIYDPQYGACFTFNNQEVPRYTSTRAGPLYGLRLLLKSNQSEYIATSKSVGARVSVHGQGQEPFPDAFGYNAAAGFTTSFGIKFMRNTRLANPYGDCRETSDSSFYYEGSYNAEGCFRSCFQDHIKTTCNCYDPRYGSPETGGSGNCKTVDINCVSKEDSHFNAIRSCNCPQPCNESTYGVTVSTALWPSDKYKPPECKETSVSWSSEEECQKWYAFNTMLLEVYYERMNYQVLSESEAYGVVNLVSDMGGQLGLWIGVSAITLVEFCSLMVLLCLYCMQKKRGSDHDDDDSDDEDDDEDEEEKKERHSPPPAYNIDESMSPPPAVAVPN